MQGDLMESEPTKYCDLVMKGGITSGIVYPNAVLALAKQFRLKNIGGTSAGAIAAAVCAAAALGDRRKHGKSELQQEPGKVGFEGLQTVSKSLSAQGFIYSLFQPAPGARNAFRVVVVLAGKAGALRKGISLLIAVLAIAPIETLLVLAALLALGYRTAGLPGIWAALLPAVLCAYAGGASFSILRVARAARSNLLGLCTGRSLKGRLGKDKPALTEWLHQVLQELSGKSPDQPLTFTDLWTAPRYAGEPNTPYAMTLQMITTGVSHHEPRTLPFENAAFWFRRDQFDLLFPSEVVNWMVNRAGPPVRVDGIDYYRLPDGGDLPVLVGMRMSLSFPLLISAVPLHQPISTAEVTAFRVCWFSDGGISSNFPIHLFDAALPRWPTFALDLVYPDTADKAGPHQPEIFLPSENNQGWQRRYQTIARPGAVQELGGFLFGIVATMQNWRDLLQSRAPGQRDRIVHISLTGNEGGMNLDMPQPVLDNISRKGTAAGEALQEFSFDNHHWVRWRNLISALQRYTVGIAESVNTEPKIPDYMPAYQTVESGIPEPPSYSFRSQHRQAEAEKILQFLIRQGKEWKDNGPDLTNGAPKPLPQLQIVPVY
jgi:predicted acylesterase/phospholipase RssA